MNTLENGLNVTETVQKATLLPPFAYDCQPVARQGAENIPFGDLAKEQSRLQRMLRDEVLESMHKQLWYTGRKGNVSPLHHQKVIRREIILTERARLHLVWFDKTIYVQRLDDELLDWGYFSRVVCGDEAVYRAASGFLLSYTRLIEYPSDLEIAKTHGLVNKDIDWRKWQTFRGSVLHHLTYSSIPPRKATPFRLRARPSHCCARETRRLSFPAKQTICRIVARVQRVAFLLYNSLRLVNVSPL